MSCLYLTVSLVSRCIPVFSHFAADPLYPAVSHCIQLYPYVSSCIQLYLLYRIVSHRLENGIGPKLHSRGGLVWFVIWCLDFPVFKLIYP